MTVQSAIVPTVAPEAGHSLSQGFGEQSISRVAETASFALAEQAKAAVQARYIMAMQRPRDLLAARSKLLADCKRPGFADAAIYNKPVGDGVEGPSIRLAEAAARAMGNIYAEVAAIYDDREKRIVRVSATDLEANVTYPMDVTINKTIERTRPQEGRKVLMVRKNSKGREVFVIEATDEEILDKERSTASKALRTCLLRLIPGDILDEALEQCYATRRGEIQKDPSVARKKMVDAYAVLGITAAQLADYLGHPLDATTAAEVDHLRSVYAAIRDKETTWTEALDHRRGRSESAQPEPSAPSQAASRSVADALARKADAARGEKASAPATPAAKETEVVRGPEVSGSY